MGCHVAPGCTGGYSCLAPSELSSVDFVYHPEAGRLFLYKYRPSADLMFFFVFMLL
jgi:hypothetical protein